METSTRTLDPKTKESAGVHVVLRVPNDPCVPPKSGFCFINCLPPELLSRIFVVGSANEDDFENEHRTHFWDHAEPDKEDTHTARSSSHFHLPFPFLVSHVCCYWRNVALSTPSPWTTIVVPSEARPPYKCESSLLERSDSLPIDIYIKCGRRRGDGGTPSSADLRFLFGVLIPHIHRCRTMKMRALKYYHAYAFLTAVSDPRITAAPRLTTLELYDRVWAGEYDSFEYPVMSKHFTLFGGSAPLLTTVVLWGTHINWNQPWIAFASNLRDLQLKFHAEGVRPTSTEFATILRSASALERLELLLSGPFGDPAGWFTEPSVGNSADFRVPIRLAHLTHLDLRFHSQPRAIGLLRMFHLPALKSLYLDLDEGDYTDFVRELVKPAASSSPSREPPRSLLSRLEKLCIIVLSCQLDCIELLYGELRNVKVFKVGTTYLHERFRDILCMSCALDGSGGTWLPRLATLYVNGTDGDNLRELVFKRRDMGVPLTSLYVRKGAKVDKEDVKWLRENVKTFKFFEVPSRGADGL